MPAASPRHHRDPSLVALGLAIRTLRLAKGLSQEELADRASLDRSYMSSIERGVQNAGMVSILRVVRALDTTAGQLFFEAGL
ncbi:MAG TPA: helix-turn-helix transcriptional regulator [Rubrivivax sp.]|nr:helix-turn-helix transcriptional regulator [Rubrivivax sp.]